MKTSKEQMSEREFNKTFMQHIPLIRHCAKRQNQGIEKLVDMEDLVQEVLLKMWGAREKYDEQKGTVQSWIATITRNTTIKYWKASQRHATYLLEGISEEQTIHTMPKYKNTKNYTPEDISNGGLEEFEKYLFGDKSSLIGKCGIGMRRIGYLRHYFNMSVKETSEYEGVTPKTVTMGSHRFKKQLKAILEEN
ncbi:sigma-70 family RNA polymerase sigma factor [Candidatus Pacearchaeota archaeon]|nr:sigma-70 family RNA polymerase sigma factor [Candidatus Pacearchaeota archaeon]